MRRAIPLLLLAAAGCADSGTGTLSGSQGRLYFERADWLPGSGEITTANVVIATGSDFTTQRSAIAGTVDWPAISRDGQWIAYTRDGRLYVAETATGHETALTPETVAADASPAWSPSGQRLLLVRNHVNVSTQLITIARDGSDPQPVLERSVRPVFSPDWSPDGKVVVYIRPDPIWPDTLRIYKANTFGESVQEIARGYRSPAVVTWAAAGHHIAFTASPGANGRVLYIMNDDGSNLRAVTGPEIWGRPSWSPDGKRIAYEAHTMVNGTRRSEIRVVDIASGTIEVVTPNSASDRDPAWGR